MKMLLVAALLAASVATANAQELPTPLKRAHELVIMINYDAECGGVPGVPPKTKIDLEKWNWNPAGFGIDRNLTSTEIDNVLQQIKTIGKLKWCAAFKPIIQEMEDAR